ncbi:MAG: hypothetical protein K2W99_03700 [Chthoniobacterales bacterium]|nr:hypothetical protein [Chthoniobacterales bacterium]
MKKLIEMKLEGVLKMNIHRDESDERGNRKKKMNSHKETQKCQTKKMSAK